MKIVWVIVRVLLSNDQEDVQEKLGETEREVSTEVLFMEILKEIVMVVLSGLPSPVGEWESTNGTMKVLNCHWNSFLRGAPTLDRVPARTVVEYVVFSVRLEFGTMVRVLLSADQEVVQEKLGEKESEASTEDLFMEILKEIVMVVSSGSSSPVGEWETTTGMMNVLNSQEKLFSKGAVTLDSAPARTVML
jgi:hypothetical protein